MNIKLYFIFSCLFVNLISYSVDIATNTDPYQHIRHAYVHVIQTNRGFSVGLHDTASEIFKQCREKGICKGPKNSLTMFFECHKIQEGTEEAEKVPNKDILTISENKNEVYIEYPDGTVRTFSQSTTPRDIINQIQRETGKKYILHSHLHSFTCEEPASNVKLSNLRPSPHTDYHNPMNLIEIH